MLVFFDDATRILDTRLSLLTAGSPPVQCHPPDGPNGSDRLAAIVRPHRSGLDLDSRDDPTDNRLS
jgi:hypothetical protein